VAEATSRDKKRVGDAVPFVLLEAPGDVRHGVSVSREELDQALAELCA
jgi:3-dehydroquinate synthetase